MMLLPPSQYCSRNCKVILEISGIYLFGEKAGILLLSTVRMYLSSRCYALLKTYIVVLYNYSKPE